MKLTDVTRLEVLLASVATAKAAHEAALHTAVVATRNKPSGYAAGITAEIVVQKQFELIAAYEKLAEWLTENKVADHLKTSIRRTGVKNGN